MFLLSHIFLLAFNKECSGVARISWIPSRCCLSSWLKPYDQGEIVEKGVPGSNILCVAVRVPMSMPQIYSFKSDISCQASAAMKPCNMLCIFRYGLANYEQKKLHPQALRESYGVHFFGKNTARYRECTVCGTSVDIRIKIGYGWYSVWSDEKWLTNFDMAPYHYLCIFAYTHFFFCRLHSCWILQNWRIRFT